MCCDCYSCSGFKVDYRVDSEKELAPVLKEIDEKGTNRKGFLMRKSFILTTLSNATCH
jgi:hypothetical protein